MKKHINKKRVVLAAIVTVALALASGVAYAYWTSTGSGNGSMTAAASITGITVNQTGTLTAMFPGDAAQTLHGTFTNSTGSPVYVGHVNVSISKVEKPAGTLAVGCDATDFDLNGSAAVNAEVPVGSPSTMLWSGHTIQFKDKTTSNQDACKGATVLLSYSTTTS